MVELGAPVLRDGIRSSRRGSIGGDGVADVAIVLVHFKNGFFLPTGYEYAFTLLFVMIAIAVGGPGEYAIDQRFVRRDVAPGV